MRSPLPVLLAVLMIGSILLTGCHSGQRYAFANVPGDGPRVKTRFPGASASTAEPAPAPTPEASTEQAAATRSTRTDAPSPHLVGIYGELGDESTSRPIPDGSRNLAQVTRFTEGACFDPEVDRSGKLLAFASTVHGVTSDIYIKSVGGATVRKITADPANDVMPAVSPDGQSVAYASDRAGNWDILITGLDGGRARQLTSDPEHELHPTWSPDGRKIAYCKFGAQSQRWEIWMIDLDMPGVQSFLTYGLYPQWSPDVTRNKILFQRARERGSRLFGVWTIDLIDGEATHLTEIVSAGNAAVMHPAWSPDGSRIVFSTVVNPDPDALPATADLWTIGVDGSNRIGLTRGEHANFQPTWGPNGLVYFVSNRSGTENIWSVGAGSEIPFTPETGVVTVDPSTDSDRQP